ncbi:GNAT family N-acetyltransferase [Sinobacterium caligoides]|nr:GNAT family N-acetyltransferase [Sinobacterium caligoides]
MLSVQFIDSMSDISRQDWNEIAGTNFPFTRHEFLQALEDSAAVTARTGWQPHHALIYDDQALVAALPLYLKSHSYGEYVFDFQWANAYQQQRLDYYPKLVSSIPFTPVTGPRLCLKAGYDEQLIVQNLLKAIQQLATENSLSGWHLLFPNAALSRQLLRLGAPRRRAVHFRWQNNNFHSFDDFLATFSSRKRKNLRRERQKIVEQDISIETLTGHQITPAHWRQFALFYRQTYAKKSGHAGYLDHAFFLQVGETMSEHTVLMLAKCGDRYVAGALSFQDAEHLYGRYWGCSEEFDSLHFELCYYQGIDYCITHGLKQFDPGVQGEHKIQRGFQPYYSYSNHWLKHPGFHDAITRFIDQEDAHIDRYKAEATALLPFKSNSRSP